MTADAPALLIALTGGIASGKTAVADHFARLGVTVLDTDQIARDVVEPGQPTLQTLVATFGTDILQPDGRLDRAAMRQRVFNDPSQRRALEAIMHPAINSTLLNRSQRAGGEYQIHVIPLLAEGSRAKEYDRVLVVDVDETTQLSRLMSRDGSSSELACKIIASQASREQRLAIADDVIRNDGTLEELQQRVELLHHRYLALARDHREGPLAPGDK